MSDERQEIACLFGELARLSAETSHVQAAICRIMGGNPDAAMNAGRLATDAEMDGAQGDPVVTFDPKGWRGTGPGAKGLRYSACSWQFLEFWADVLESMAATPAEGKEKYVKSNLRDARRARTWSQRIKAGWTPPPAPPRPEYAPRDGAANGGGYGAASGGYGSYNAGTAAPAQPKSDDWSSR